MSAAITIWTDGCCSSSFDGSDGPGGWAFIAVNAAGGVLARRSGAAIETDGNRMELTAVVEALRETPAIDVARSVHVFTDSHFVAHGFNHRLRHGKLMKGRGGRDADLWRRLAATSSLLSASVTIERVKRAIHPLNAEADLAAKAAMRSEYVDSTATQQLLNAVGRALRDPKWR